MPLLVDPALPAGSLRTIGQPHLDAGGLTLRPWRPDDLPAVRTAFDCPVIQRWHVRRMADDNEAKAWIASWALRWTAETDASWAVVNSADQPLGQVGFRALSLFEASAEVSYWVLPDARGAGIAVHATKTMTHWAFGTLRLNRLLLQHSTANKPSCRVAHKTGFAVEGTLRRSMRHTDGWHDVHVHARLQTDS